MPLGKNNSGDFHNGTPVTLPVTFGQPVTLPKNYGNTVPTSGTEQNTVTWTPSPTHFGNSE